MTKKIWLEGHQFDLQELAQLLASGDTRVVRDGDRFYLTSPEIDNPPEGVEYYDAAEKLLVRINGLGRLSTSDFRPVALSGECTEGESEHLFIRVRPLEIRMGMGNPTVTVTNSDGNVVPDQPSPWPDRFALAASNSDLAEVLQIMGQPEPLGWSDLYNVFEIIEHSDSRSEKMHRLPGMTKASVSRFTGTAGPRRHARPTGVHRNPMSLAEGRDFANRLVIAWMSTLGR
jgi:hypothetical protein